MNDKKMEDGKMQRKKSKFWLFVFSFMPGAGQMYMGFMKMGIGLMFIFITMIAVISYFNLGFLTAFPFVIYFYSFFHAHNLGSMDDLAFNAVEDSYLFGLDSLGDMEYLKEKLTGKNKKIVAAALVVIGVMMLWHAVFDLLFDIFGWDAQYLRVVYFFMRDDLPRFLVGIIIIWIGVVMIRGKKVDSGIEEEHIFTQPSDTEVRGIPEIERSATENSHGMEE